MNDESLPLPFPDPNGPAKPGSKDYDALLVCREEAERLQRGTTDAPFPERLKVIWLGRYLGLVKRAGGKFWAALGSQGYAPAAYHAYDRRLHRRAGVVVFSGGKLLPPGLKWKHDGVSVLNDLAEIETRVFIGNRAGALQGWIRHLQGLDEKYPAHAAVAEKELAEKQERGRKAIALLDEQRKAQQKLQDAAPELAKALRSTVWALAEMLAERARMTGPSLTVKDVLRGHRPATAGGAWDTLSDALKVLKKAGVPDDEVRP